MRRPENLVQNDAILAQHGEMRDMRQNALAVSLFCRLPA
jgi:hypothetical protein